jgi:gluconolactonase
MPYQKVNRREFLYLAGCIVAGSWLAACTPGEPVKETPGQSPPDPSETAIPDTPETIEVKMNDKPTIRVLAQGLDFPEGPAFDPQGILWCVELLGGNLVRYEAGQVQRFPTNGRPNGLAFDRKGRAWICDSGQNAIRRYDPASNTWETLADSLDGEPLQSPNDLCFDPAGNLLFTCPNFADTRQTGYVCCLKPDGTVLRIGEGFYRPNGLGLLEKGTELVVADTYQKALFRGKWDAQSAAWSDPQKWVVVGGAEGPDGMAYGQNGLLYQAVYGDGVIRVVDATGSVTDEFQLPGQNPTNTAIDPSGALGIVVTEAETGQLLSLPELQPGVELFDGGEYWP